MQRRVVSGRTAAVVILMAGLCAAFPTWEARPAAHGEDAMQDALGPTGATAPTLAVVFYSGRGGNQDVYLLPPGGREPVNLTRHPARDLCPAPSPDGRRIAFLSDRGGNLDVYSMAIDGSELRQLTSSPDTEMHPEYSPDGSRIVFLRDFQQRAEIWIMNADGSGQTRLTSGGWRDERPFVSPDGSTILFMSTRDGNYEIYTMAVDGSRQTRLTNTPQLEIFPAWSPDGTKIVYSQKYRVGNAMEGGIRVMNADHSNDHAVTGIETRDENGLWSPDGRRIIFQSVRDGYFEVYQVDADGRNAVRLTHDPAWDGWASYVPASKERPTAKPLERQPQGIRSGTVTDPRDGATYRWVVIGGQTWMAENLRYKTDRGSWCWQHVEANCADRGRLYDWAAAMQAPPPGWHLPSDEEWKELEIALGLTRADADREGSRVDRDGLLAGKIKAKGRWPTVYKGTPIVVTDQSGFSAIQTGHYTPPEAFPNDPSRNRFDHDGYTAWWTCDGDPQSAFIRVVHFFDNAIDRIKNRKVFAFPVRCVKNAD